MSYEAPTYKRLSHEDLATETKIYGGDGSEMLSSGNSAYIEQYYQGQIKQLLNKIADLRAKIDNDNEVIADQQRDYFDLKKENIILKQKIEKYESGNSSSPVDDFIYLIVPRLFKDVDKLWVKRFWANMYELTNNYSADGSPIISQKRHVAIIFTLLKNHSVHPFIGSSADFAYFWNENVVSRILDPEERKRLRVDKKGLIADLNKPLLRDYKPYEWNRMSLDGGTNAKAFQLMNTLKIKVEDLIQKTTIG